MKPINLKQLIQLINDGKDLNTDLCLDEGCFIEAEDPKPLVKVINYVMNYLANLSKEMMSISLDLNGDSVLLNFLVPTTSSELPEINAEVNSVLGAYKASLERKHEAGKYVQIKILFSH